MYSLVNFDQSSADDCMEHTKCRRIARQKIITELYTEMYRRELSEGKCNDVALQSLYDVVQADKKDKEVKFMWITVNPKDDEFALSQLEAKIDLLKGKKYVQSLKWTYEQRGESLTDVHGIHCHILLECFPGCRKDSVKRSLHNIFNSLCGNPRAVDIRSLRDSWVSDKVDYLRGHKWDESKDEKVSVDIQWRQELGLEQVYEFTSEQLLVEDVK